MKSLFEAEAYSEIKQRLNSINPESEQQWGKMQVDQMVWHCKKPLELSMEKTTMEPPNFFMKLLFSFVKPSIYNNSPWKKG